MEEQRTEYEAYVTELRGSQDKLTLDTFYRKYQLWELTRQLLLTLKHVYSAAMNRLDNYHINSMASGNWHFVQGLILHTLQANSAKRKQVLAAEKQRTEMQNEAPEKESEWLEKLKGLLHSEVERIQTGL